jgi:hypothetical protein
MPEAQGGVDVFPWSTDKLPKSAPLSIRDLVGRILRVVEDGQVVTQEYIPGRVTIYKTKDGRIGSISVEADNDR